MSKRSEGRGALCQTGNGDSAMTEGTELLTKSQISQIPVTRPLLSGHMFQHVHERHPYLPKEEVQSPPAP